MSSTSKPATLGKLQHRHVGAIASVIVISLLSSLSGLPLQHTISNVWDGCLWGVADPVLHWNSLVNLLAIGLFSAGLVHGAIVTNTFVLASVLGLITHLLQFHLPSAEIAIAVSILAVGIMLITPNRSNLLIVVILGAIAGLFQGHLTGHTITGTDLTSSLIYTSGMAFTHYTVATTARKINSHSLPLAHFVGFALASIGIVFLAT
ncbi:HupE/UreJ family protein [Anabaena azotica]|uniref:HupE/UreJ family protein n=1 Tax=Anabaena azotica FACHB-119 TaxID=947527 RepID=A0ABR8D1X1_9NOST|nr:HupE/UreJ family protein [Anabaena azotica]MBD2499748.1 HupE/UreJ family protein [Anabaena azotica FACHB-119]